MALGQDFILIWKLISFLFLYNNIYKNNWLYYKMKIMGVTVALVIGLILIVGLIFLIRSPEDDWIKDSRGVWIKHGNPASTPDYVLEQQEAINCSLNLYQEKKNEGMVFSSQCLGVCGNHAVDIVHVPRNEEDNLQENQCLDYREGIVNKFIELDKDGNVVRVV